MQFFLITCKLSVDPFDQVMDPLPGNAVFLRRLTVSEIPEYYILIHFSLMCSQQISIEVIQKRLFYNLFHITRLGKTVRSGEIPTALNRHLLKIHESGRCVKYFLLTER